CRSRFRMARNAAQAASVFAFAIGVAHRNAGGATIDCYFPAPLKDPEPGLEEAIAAHFAEGVNETTPETVARFVEALGGAAALAGRYRPLLDADRPLTVVRLGADQAIASTEEAYLKLHLLSHRLALPNSLVLDG